MKTFLAIFLSFLFASCATTKKPAFISTAPTIVNTTETEKSISDGKRSVSEIKVHNLAILGSLGRSLTLLERIDYKASLVEEELKNR